MSDPAPRILICLTPLEREDFLTQEDHAWLETLPNSVWSEPPPLTAVAEDWSRLLLAERPDILVAAWKTPGLPLVLLEPEHRFLKYVCYLAGSVRKLIPRSFLENGLLVSNWGTSVSAVVAECGLMLILMAHRRAAYWSVAMHREGAWKNELTVTQSLLGRRVGLHGFGAIAQALLPMLRPFGVSVQAYAPQTPEGIFTQLGVQRAASLEALFAENEVIVELAPYTPENRHLVGEALLRRIPTGGVFVNLGRGAVVDEDALLAVAREGKIQIGLDVYETEPLPVDSPFRGLPNVTLLPHLGGPTKDRRCDAGAFGINNLRRYLQGRLPDSLVSLEIYDRAS